MFDIIFMILYNLSNEISLGPCFRTGG